MNVCVYYAVIMCEGNGWIDIEPRTLTAVCVRPPLDYSAGDLFSYIAFCLQGVCLTLTVSAQADRNTPGKVRVHLGWFTELHLPPAHVSSSSSPRDYRLVDIPL